MKKAAVMLLLALLLTLPTILGDNANQIKKINSNSKTSLHVLPTAPSQNIQISSSSFNITGLTIDPNITEFGNLSQSHDINFNSTTYPINLTIIMINESDFVVNSLPTTEYTALDLPFSTALPAVSDGVYRVIFNFSDGIDHLSINPANTTIDTVGPNVSNVTTVPKIPGSFGSQNTTILVTAQIHEYPVNISFTLFNQSHIVDTSEETLVTGELDFPIQYATPESLGELDYTLNITLTDIYGNSNTTTVGVLSIDKTPPSISIDPSLKMLYNATNNSVFLNFSSSEFPLNITVTATNLTGTLFSLNITEIDNVTDLPYQIMFPYMLTYGLYNMTGIFSDQFQNNDTVDLGEFNIVSTELIIQNIQSSLSSAVHTNGTQDIFVDINFTSNQYPVDANLNLYDSIGDLVDQSVIYQISDGNDLPVAHTISSGLTEDYYNLTLNASTPNGTKEFLVNTIIVDQTAPSINVLSTDPTLPLFTNQDAVNITINLSISEEQTAYTMQLESGNQTAQVIADNLTTTTAVILYNVTNLTEKEYNITIALQDRTENQNNQTLGKIVVDTTAPMFSYSSSLGLNILTNKNISTNITLNTSEYPLTINISMYSTEDQWWSSSVLAQEDNISFSPLVQAEGNYSINITAQDQAGNTKTEFIGWVQIDSSPAQINFTTTPSLFLKTNVSTVIQIQSSTGETPLQAQIELVNQTGAVVDTQPYTVTSSIQEENYTFSANYSDGNFTLNITTTDSFGNILKQTLGVIELNTTLLEVTSLQTIPILPIITNTLETLNVTFTSNLFPLQTQLNIGSHAKIVKTISNQSSLPAQYSNNVTLPDGNHTVSIQINSSINNKTFVLGILTVDSVSPTIINTSLQTLYPSPNQSSQIQIWASEALKNARVIVYDTSIILNQTLNAQNSSYINDTYTLPISTSDGNYSVNISFQDLAGNKNNEFITQIKVDTAAPNISIDPALSMIVNETSTHMFINFSSDEYPVTLTTSMYNSSGLMFTLASVVISNSSNLPTKAIFPSALNYGTYNATGLFADNLNNTITVNLGEFTLSVDNLSITNIDFGTNRIVYKNKTEEETIQINFTSNKYPIDVNFILYNQTQDPLNQTIPIQVDSAAELPLDYTISSGLTQDIYNLSMNVSTGNETTLVYIGDIIVDWTAPTINITSTTPTFPIITNQDAVNLTVGINTNDAGAAYTIQAQRNAQITQVKTENLTNTTATIVYNITNLTQEEYNITIALVDKAKNENKQTIGKIIIDTVVALQNLNTNLPLTTNQNSPIELDFTLAEITNLTYKLIGNSQNYTGSQQQINTNFTNLTYPNNLTQDNYTVQISLLDAVGNSNTTIIGNLIIDKTTPTMQTTIPSQIINVSKLAAPITLNFSEEIKEVTYKINNTIFNLTNDLDNNNIQKEITILEYGYTQINITFKDHASNINSSLVNFTTKLIISVNATVNDSDGDGINDSADTLIGSSENIQSSFENISIAINNSQNLSQVFSDEVNVTINSGSEPILEFTNDFGINTLNLTSLVIEEEVADGVAKMIVRGLTLQENETKTLYFDKSNQMNTFNSICIVDRQINSLDEVDASCSGVNETLVNQTPLVINGYNVTYTNASNTTVKVQGVRHTGIIQICSEDWTCTAWSACTNNQRTRQCTDQNSCGTALLIPPTTLSCQSSSSSGGSGGGSDDFKLSEVIVKEGGNAQIQAPVEQNEQPQTQSKNKEENKKKQEKTQEKSNPAQANGFTRPQQESELSEEGVEESSEDNDPIALQGGLIIPIILAIVGFVLYRTGSFSKVKNKFRSMKR